MSLSPKSTNGNVVAYDWVIPNFCNCSSHYTSNFSFPSNNKVKFRFWINPKIVCPFFGDAHTTIFLNIDSCNRDRIKLKNRISLVNAKGGKCNTQESLAVYKNGNSNCVAKCSIPHADLLDSFNGWLVNNTLTIHCEAELIEDDSLQSGLQAKQEDLSSISNHYESLLESSKHSDVVLAIGEKEYRAHKLVLSARSSVFSAMFDHSGTKEAQQGRVEIVDVAVEVFELFLRYIYTGKIDELDRFAPELLAVADMYQMDCLKSLCEHFLCSTLTIENVSQLLIHADLYRADILKSKCADYITDNSEKIKTTEGWKAVVVKIDLVVLLFDKFSIKHNSASK